VSEVVWEAFREAAPYISNLTWFRRALEGLKEYWKDPELLAKKLEELAGEDVTKRNDVKIYLMYLRKKGGGRGVVELGASRS